MKIPEQIFWKMNNHNAKSFHFKTSVFLLKKKLVVVDFNLQVELCRNKAR